jgi:hypothetical protein
MENTDFGSGCVKTDLRRAGRKDVKLIHLDKNKDK